MPWTHAVHPPRRVRRDRDDRLADVRRDVRRRPPQLPQASRATRRGRKSAWTTTLAVRPGVRAASSPTRITARPGASSARNLDVTVARPTSEYRGQARFSNGTVAIQNYVPMRADMSTTFRIVDGKIVARPHQPADRRRADRSSPATWTCRSGPSRCTTCKSTIDFPRMREIFFAHDNFTLLGDGDFTGTFHLFKEQLPNGRTRTGRELKGTFSSADGRRQRLPVRRSARLGALGAGAARGHRRDRDALRRRRRSSAIKMAPLGAARRAGRPRRSTPPTTNVDLTDVHQLPRAAGAAARRPRDRATTCSNGRSAVSPSTAASGELRVDPPAGIDLMTRRCRRPTSRRANARRRAWGPFDNHAAAPTRCRSAATITYTFDPDGIDIGPSRFATPSTYVEFEGRTAYGERSRIPFHVTQRRLAGERSRVRRAC